MEAMHREITERKVRRTALQQEKQTIEIQLEAVSLKLAMVPEKYKATPKMRSKCTEGGASFDELELLRVRLEEQLAVVKAQLEKTRRRKSTP